MKIYMIKLSFSDENIKNGVEIRYLSRQLNILTLVKGVTSFKIFYEISQKFESQI